MSRLQTFIAQKYSGIIKPIFRTTNILQEFELFKAKYPEATVELWAMDEHRLGLKPIFRRVWTPVGVQPTVEVN